MLYTGLKIYSLISILNNSNRKKDIGLKKYLKNYTVETSVMSNRIIANVSSHKLKDKSELFNVLTDRTSETSEVRYC